MDTPSRKTRYAAYLLSPHWTSLRSQVHSRTNFKCEACGSTEGHEVHHLHYGTKGDWSDITPIDLIGLCPTCHHLAHEVYLNRTAFLPAIGLLRRKALLKALDNHYHPKPPTPPKPRKPKLVYNRTLAKAAKLSGRNAARLKPDRLAALAKAPLFAARAAMDHHKRPKRLSWSYVFAKDRAL
jgi:hypothetical protein